MKLQYLLKREIYESKRSLLIFSLTIFLILLFQEMGGSIAARFKGGMTIVSWYDNNFPGFLYLGGFILTSVFFSQDMFNRTGQHHWLMLPASSEEKFLSKAFITAVGYPIALTALFFLSSVIIESMTTLFFKDAFILFNPWTKEVGWMLLHYLVIQSVFLLGATYFRKAHFVKTILALGIIGFAASLIGTLFIRIVFAPYFTGFFQPMNIQFSFSQGYEEQFLKGFFTLMKVIYWALLAPFCWFVAYLRVKEVQATDAIQ
jgi:hypothetical protein